MTEPLNLVEHRGFEPLTSTMRTLRADYIFQLSPSGQKRNHPEMASGKAGASMISTSL